MKTIMKSITGCVIAVLLLTSCVTIERPDRSEHVDYELALKLVKPLDKGGRWLSLGIKEINELDNLGEMEKNLVNHHLLDLIYDKELRFDKTSRHEFIGQLQADNYPKEAIAAVERAYIRVTSPLNYHEGYWVAEMEIPGSLMKIQVINDMHIDAATKRVTVYAQSRVMGNVLAPSQVSPGEYTTLPNGEKAGFHPNAVYLNGSGVELRESDGTGAWWVKHSWVLGGEGYENWELKPQEDYGEGLWVEGHMLEDGITMKIGDPAGKWGYNLRKPVFEGNIVTYRVIRYEAANLDPEAGPIDYTMKEGFVIHWRHENEKSPFDGLARSGPEVGDNNQ